MTTGSCNYENGLVDSAFDCDCDECKTSVKAYENYLNEQAEQDEYNNIIASQGVCHELQN